MCLFKDTIFPRFSFRDKVVYKVLRMYTTSSNIPNFRTPYMNTPVELNSTLKAANKNWFHSIFDYGINDEGVFAYTSIERAVEKYEINGTTKILVKCVIPKFTLYWTEKKADVIAARKLFITDEIIEIV